ncbi:MAG: hypothetical protein C0511_10350 [Hyphomicrobium sp.]|nr:hypothetical protein [Hyphomicrobium sp.]PPC81660.1 MAG: hypothetical protein CTY40_06560 [Hyphomicrobium sp.]
MVLLSSSACRRLGLGISLVLLPIFAISAVVATQRAPPSFVDERRLPLTEAEAEAKRKAEEQALEKAKQEERRLAAEAEAKRKAEEQALEKAKQEERRLAAEAEAKRKAEEQALEKAKQEERRLAAEAAEAKRKAEEQAQEKAKQEERRLATEAAEAKRKAEEQAQEKAKQEERRLATEADAKRKAEEQAQEKAKQEERRQQAAVVAPTIAAGGAAARSVAECGNDKIAAQAIPGGRFKIEIEAPCRANQSFVIQYGQFVFQRQFDTAGRGTAIVDLFQGKDPPLSLQFADGKRQSVSPEAVDLRGLSKVAVVWQAAVNLDLHAYEYSTLPGTKGHVWVRSPSSADTALAETQSTKRGRGFLSTSDDGRGSGDKVEVYTFWHHDEQQSGVVATALDYESRGDQPGGDVCGSGPQASVAFETILITPFGRVSRERGSIAAAPCGVQLSGNNRFMEDAVPDISAKR